VQRIIPAANTGVLTFMDNMEMTQNLPVGIKTVAASASAGLFRIFLMPVDTVKVSWWMIEGGGGSLHCSLFIYGDDSGMTMCLMLHWSFPFNLYNTIYGGGGIGGDILMML
jgi:hypothetical protein